MNMRLHQWVTLTALLLGAISTAAAAGDKVWEPLPRLPYIGSVNSIARASDGVLYITTAEHVYRATDQDQTWTPIGEDVFWGTISDVAVDPEDPNIIVVGTDTKIFWTRNGGTTWSSQRFEVNPHTGLGGGAGNIRIHPSSKTIFADSYRVSLNGAWQRVIPDRWVFSFVFPSDKSVIGVANGSPMSDIVRSVNGGQSWTTVGAVPGSGSLYLGKNNRVYGMFTHYQTSTTGTIVDYPAMYSDDLGATWTEIEVGYEGLPVQDGRLTVLGVDTTNNRIYTTVQHAGSTYSKGVYYSDDNMTTWTLLDPDFRDVEPVEMLLTDDGRIFVTTMSDGVLEYNPFRSQPVGARNVGLFSYTANTIAITKTNDMIAYSYGGMQISRDGGQSWRRSRPGALNSVYSLLDLPSGDIFAGTIGFAGPQYDHVSPALYRSANGGESWTPLGEELMSTNANWTQITDLFVDNNNRLYAAILTSGDTALPFALYTSADNGAHWQTIGEMLPTTVVAPSGIIYTIGMTPTFSFAFLRSSDMGVTWDTLTPPVDISFNSNPILTPGSRGELYFSAQNTAEFVSFDNGTTWSVESYQQFRVYFDSEGTAYRVLDGKTVYLVTPNSAQLIDITNGLPTNDITSNVSIMNIDFDANDVPFASLSDGRIFKLASANTTEVGNSASGDKTSTAYPNPFSDIVNISYSLAAGTPVTITITDVPGRVLQTLRLPLQQAGEHTVSLRGDTFAPGLYIYTILAGNSVQTGTIIRR
jgi:photosystem II stability/assembly factor-like uncharacterized protein